MRIRIKDISLVIAIVTLIFMAGCIGQEEVKERKQLIIAMPNEIEVLDTQQAYWSDIPNGLVSQPLVNFDMELANLVPDLVESFEISADGKTITFHLPEDYKYSNGDPLNAQALKASFERYEAISPYSGDLAIFGDEGRSVLDDTTLELVCSESPASSWAYITSDYGAPWDAAEAERIGDDQFAAKAVASGPFKLKEWVHGSHILLERNDNYRTNLPYIENKGPPKLEEVMIRFIPEDLTRVSELEAGTVDIITEVPTGDVDKLKEHPEIHLLEAPSPGYTPLCFNHLKPPFDDVKVRGAIASAIDRDAIVTALAGTVNPRYSLLAPGQLCYSPEMEEYAKNLHPYNVEAAKALLADAGWTDTDGDGWVDKDGQKFTAELLVASDDPPVLTISVVVQTQLQAIGLDVKIAMHDFDYINNELRERTYELAFSRWSWLDPSDIYYLVYDWWAHVGFEDLEDELVQARYIMDLEERTKVYSDIQKVLIDGVAWVPVFTRNMYTGVRNWVQDIVFHRLLAGTIYLNDVTIKEEE